MYIANAKMPSPMFLLSVELYFEPLLSNRASISYYKTQYKCL